MRSLLPVTNASIRSAVGSTAGEPTGHAGFARVLQNGNATSAETNPWEAAPEVRSTGLAADHGWQYIAAGTRGNPTVQLEAVPQLSIVGMISPSFSTKNAEIAFSTVSYPFERCISACPARVSTGSPQVKRFVDFSCERAGKEPDDDFVTHLECIDSGRAMGTIFDLMGLPAGAPAEQRRTGPQDEVRKHRRIRVIGSEADSRAQPAERAAA